MESLYIVPTHILYPKKQIILSTISNTMSKIASLSDWEYYIEYAESVAAAHDALHTGPHCNYRVTLHNMDGIASVLLDYAKYKQLKLVTSGDSGISREPLQMREGLNCKVHYFIYY